MGKINKKIKINNMNIEELSKKYIKPQSAKEKNKPWYIRIEFALELFSKRLDLGLTTGKAAKILGMTKAQYERLEAGLKFK